MIVTGKPKGGARRGAGRPSGIPNPNAGALPTIVRIRLGKAKKSASYTHAPIPITRCNGCGSIWHDGYTETRFDLRGETIEERAFEAEREWHKEGCPVAAENALPYGIRGLQRATSY